MSFLVATTSLPAVYRPNDDARTTTAGTPHARARIILRIRLGCRFRIWIEKKHLALGLSPPEPGQNKCYGM